jgi:hypothetical protein
MRSTRLILVAAATAVLSKNAFTLAALVIFAGCTSPSIAPNNKVDDSTFKQLSIYDAEFRDLLKSLHDPVFQDLLTKIQRNGGCAIPVC